MTDTDDTVTHPGSGMEIPAPEARDPDDYYQPIDNLPDYRPPDPNIPIPYYPGPETDDYDTFRDGQRDIEVYTRWLLAVDPEAIKQHANHWRRVNSMLSDVATMLQERRRKLAEAWSGDAAQVFLEHVDNTHRSTLDWQGGAYNNATLLDGVVEDVEFARKHMFIFANHYYDMVAAWQNNDGTELIVNDPRAPGWTVDTPPVATTEGPNTITLRTTDAINPETHIRQMYQPIAANVVNLLAGQYVDSHYYVDQPPRFRGPLELTPDQPVSPPPPGETTYQPPAIGDRGVPPPTFPPPDFGGFDPEVVEPPPTDGGEIVALPPVGTLPPPVATPPIGTPPVGPPPVGPPGVPPTPVPPPVVSPPVGRPPVPPPPVGRPPVPPPPPATRPGPVPIGNLRPPPPAGAPPAGGRPPVALSGVRPTVPPTGAVPPGGRPGAVPAGVRPPMAPGAVPPGGRSGAPPAGARPTAGPPPAGARPAAVPPGARPGSAPGQRPGPAPLGAARPGPAPLGAVRPGASRPGAGPTAAPRPAQGSPTLPGATATRVHRPDLRTTVMAAAGRAGRAPGPVPTPPASSAELRTAGTQPRLARPSQPAPVAQRGGPTLAGAARTGQPASRATGPASGRGSAGDRRPAATPSNEGDDQDRDPWAVPKATGLIQSGQPDRPAEHGKPIEPAG